MGLAIRDSHPYHVEEILFHSNYNLDQLDPAIFSSIGVILSSISGMLFQYQQYATAGVVYLIAMLFHGVQRIIRTATNQTSHAMKVIEHIKLHLSNSVVISLILTSQLSSPIPGVILAILVMALHFSRYKKEIQQI